MTDPREQEAAALERTLRAEGMLRESPTIEWGPERAAEAVAGQDDNVLGELTPDGRDSQQRAKIAQYGKTVSVVGQIGTRPQNQGWQTLIYVPEAEDSGTPLDWSISIQPSFMPAFGVGSLWALLQYTQGGATFTRGPYKLLSLTPQRFHVTGGRVQVEVMYLSVEGPPSPTSVDIKGGCRPSGVADSPLDFYFGQWSTANAADVVDGAAGVLMGYAANLLTMSGDTQLFLCFYDIPNSADLVSGTTLSFWASPPFTAANQWAGMEEQDDEKILFNSGCVVAWSSRPDVYTAPTAPAPTSWFKTKVGY